MFNVSSSNIFSMPLFELSVELDFELLEDSAFFNLSKRLGSVADK